MTDPVSPVTGAPMARGVRQVTITLQGRHGDLRHAGLVLGRTRRRSALQGGHDRFRPRADQAEGARRGYTRNPQISAGSARQLGLSQREAGRIIGGGPNAFQKYESGEILASRAVSNLLQVLARHPEEIERLRQRGPAQGGVIEGIARGYGSCRYTASAANEEPYAVLTPQVGSIGSGDLLRGTFNAARRRRRHHPLPCAALALLHGALAAGGDRPPIQDRASRASRRASRRARRC